MGIVAILISLESDRTWASLKRKSALENWVSVTGAFRAALERLDKFKLKHSGGFVDWGSTRSHIVTFSDTIAVGLETEADSVELLPAMAQLLAAPFCYAISTGTFLSGAISIGEFAFDEGRTSAIGPAVDEAAKWCIMADWVGLLLCPSAAPYAEHLDAEHSAASECCVRYDVPMKPGVAQSAEWALNWPSVIRDVGSGTSTALGTALAQSVEKFHLRAHVRAKVENGLSFFKHIDGARSTRKAWIGRTSPHDTVIASLEREIRSELGERLESVLLKHGITQGEDIPPDHHSSTYDALIARAAAAESPRRSDEQSPPDVDIGKLPPEDAWKIEIVFYDYVIAEAAGEPRYFHHVAAALFNKGVALHTPRLFNAELAAYNDLKEKFEHSSDIFLRETVAKALLNMGATLGAMKRHEEELMVYHELLRRVDDFLEELTMRELAAKALANRATALEDLGRVDQELMAYDELIARFREAPEPEVHKLVMTAAYKKMATLVAEGRLNDAAALLLEYDSELKALTDVEEEVALKLRTDAEWRERAERLDLDLLKARGPEAEPM